MQPTLKVLQTSGIFRLLPTCRRPRASGSSGAHVEGATGLITVGRKDLDDRVLHNVELAPAAASRDGNVDRGGLHPRPPRGVGGGAWRGRIPGPAASSTQVSRASSARRRRYAEYAAISPRTGERQARYLARTSSSRSQS